MACNLAGASENEGGRHDELDVGVERADFGGVGQYRGLKSFREACS